ncbi:MAG TPA: alpha-glucan family phosphorylase [Armatimonadota bacterium]|nr:alpha-glucan family phosphorylase [Armatimonadota bacterium]
MPKAYRTVMVSPSLPSRVEPLRGLAFDLSWTWRQDAIELFQRMDRGAWENTHHNPVAMLGEIPQERLEALADDESFLEHLGRVVAETHAYLLEQTWFDRHSPLAPGHRIGYFSLEFGISECLPIYSGGLAVLAGDHLKSASDLGVPVAAVGLLYQEGYFRQYLNIDGWQQEEYPENDFANLPVQPALGPDGTQRRITVQVGDHDVQIALWRAMVGRVSLYLLDTNLPENNPYDQEITARLYGGDREVRIRQEVVAGIGGVRALEALGIRPTVCHMNEGHCAFLALERIRRVIETEGLTFGEAAEALAVSHVFTTHTPVPAGHDVFDQTLMDRYFSHYWPQLGLTREQFLGLGREDPTDANSPFNMTVLAVRLSTWRNGVSELHGAVARRQLRALWPNVPDDDIPIDSVTNGVHPTSWISYDMSGLFDRYLGPWWREQSGEEKIWQGIYEIPDTELWRTHERRRERLVAYARRRLRQQLIARGASPAEVAQADEVLDPEALTIGFGRRFATYKRATLLLRNPDRLIELLANKDQPLQIVLAGKAHPNDRPGKDLIRQIVHFARRPECRGRIVFLEDYDMSLARYMLQGVDVWLNTPRRPNEASGTSGMKATMNGALNVSILDGWWCEGYSPDTGWAIGRGEEYQDFDYQDDVEAQGLYDLLEKEVIPLFYHRGADGLPRGWIARMKHAIRRLTPQFSSNRMVQEYAEKFYLPAAQRAEAMKADNYARARALGQWKQKVRQAWSQIRIVAVDDDHGMGTEVGQKITVTAQVDLGPLTPEDVHVELFHGRVDSKGEIVEAINTRMQCIQDEPSQPRVFRAEIQCRQAGQRGYTVRVIPEHEDLVCPFDMGLILWA